MRGLGTLVNTAAIVAGGFIGLMFRRVLNQRLTDTIMQGLALSVIMIGIGGSLSSSLTVADGEVSTKHTLVMIFSLALGALFGELIRIEEKLTGIGAWCEKKFIKSGDSSLFVQAFVSSSLIYCVGAMAIIGALEDGISGNTDILIAKSILDGISCMIFAATLGPGALFSAIPVFLYQGAITLAAVFVAPLLTPTVVEQISLVGSLLVLAMGLNILKMTKIKIGNLLPAVLIPVVFHIAASFL